MTLVAYVCVGTVIAIGLCLVYLRQTDRLSDAKMFRVMAILHDVDLDQIAASYEKSKDEVPPEEMAPDALLEKQHVLDRNFEVKMLALQRGRQAYDFSLKQLKEKTDRYDRLAQDWQARLKEEQELSTQENIATVVSQLEQVKPDVGKESIMRWIDEGRMDDAILLMSRMAENKLSKILRTFETEEELDKLHEIHRRIIGDSTATTSIEDALKQIEAAKRDT